MRPVLLDIDGFASFREKATIDFDGAEYFAFVGPTGSGKSTVIDAMTFALYGSAPRWGRSNAIAQALAPTANRCTVRLVFDLGAERYVVAREVRRSGKQISQRNTVLERVIDRDGEDVEVLAGDPGGVTDAVEQLLGLSFDDFCKCIVLPQGQFQDFLKAKPAERQAILLKLLGADRYELIRQRAAEVESGAGAKVALLSDQLGRLVDATEDVEAAAAARVDALQDVSGRLRTLLPEAVTAAAALGAAEREVTALTGDETLLAALRIPADVPDLQAALDRAESAVRETADAESACRREEIAARGAVDDGPSRSRLERLRDQYDELDAAAERLPVLTAARTEAEIVAEETRSAAAAAGAAVAEGRTRRDDAQAELTRTAAGIETLEAERADLEPARTPSGVEELGTRAVVAAAALKAAAEERDRAETAERTTRDAVTGSTARPVLQHTLTLVDDLAKRQEALRDETARLQAADAARTAATAAEQAAERLVARRHDEREALRARHTAAGLRAHLSPGEPCPVCEQTVATVPPALRETGLDDADAAHTAAVHERDHARTFRAAAERDHTARETTVGSLAERIAELGALPGRAEVEEQLARLDVLLAAASVAQAAAEQARTALRTTETAAVEAETRSRTARSQLAATHGALVRRGAPTVDVEDLAGAWKVLDDWAAARRDEMDAELVVLGIRLAETRRVLTVAEEGFAGAELAAAQAVTARDTAVRVAAGATAEADQVSRRHAELTGLLEHGPGRAAVVDGVKDCDRLEAAARAAGVAVEQARAALAAAEQDAQGRRTAVTEARRTLGRTRDTVVHLGAPGLDDADLLAAWQALLGWSQARLTEVHTAGEAARERVETAGTDLRERRGAVLQVVREHLDVGDDADLAELPALVAGDLSAARAELAGVRQRREQAADALRERATAEEEQQVARLLADLLRSTGFPRWLAGAALDTLVDDASEVLRELSGGQFDLTHDRGEFQVVDHADADSTRTVRTLSGGETFQASLALALALAQQMAALGAGGRARLESIFLDEGFGTLDPDTLEVVAGTLENLAHGERMVGVVTHVGALAERAPTRFVVSRDNRTSSVRREDA